MNSSEQNISGSVPPLRMVAGVAIGAALSVTTMWLLPAAIPDAVRNGAGAGVAVLTVSRITGMVPEQPFVLQAVAAAGIGTVAGCASWLFETLFTLRLPSLIAAIGWGYGDEMDAGLW